MARRRKKPIFIDEEIQWHLVTSKHDRCPLCGFDRVGYLGKTQRTCMNRACGLSASLKMPSTEWFRRKMAGEDIGAWSWDSRDYIARLPEEETQHSLDEAQDLSRCGLASISRKEDACGSYPLIYWRKDDYTPFILKVDGKEEEVCAPGSIYWDLLRLSYEWSPARKLSPLELLAQQAPRIEDIKERFLIMS
jgi:ribosomal protein L37E